MCQGDLECEKMLWSKKLVRQGCGFSLGVLNKYMGSVVEKL